MLVFIYVQKLWKLKSKVVSLTIHIYEDLQKDNMRELFDIMQSFLTSSALSSIELFSTNNP